MSRPQRRRKFVDSKVQGTLVRRVIFHWLVFITVASVTALLLQVLSDPFRPISEQFQDMWWTHGPFLVVMLFLLPVFVMDTVKLSHRFAGPIQNMRRVMREIADGQPPRKLQFRSNDFWHELAAEFNAMIARLVPGDRDSQEPAKESSKRVAVND